MPSIVKRTIAGAAVGGAAIWGIGGIDETTRDDSGQIVQEGDLGAFVIQVGDCLNLEDPSSLEVAKTIGVPCSNPHHWQVVLKETLSIDEFDEEVVLRSVELICKAALETIANNISYEKSVEYANAVITSLRPTEQSFANGDRTVDCLIGSSTETYTSSILE